MAKSFDALKELLTNYYVAPHNKIIERMDFHNPKQAPGESIMIYVYISRIEEIEPSLRLWISMTTCTTCLLLGCVTPR